MKNARTVAATAAAGLVLAGLASPALAKPGNNGNPNNGKKMAAAVTAEAVMGHLEAFQDIADTHGDRAAGTPGYEASADYVESTLQAAGYQTERQYFVFDRLSYDQSLTELSPTARTLEVQTMEFSPDTPEGGITAGLAAPTVDPNGCDAAAYGDAADLTGKIALVSRGACPFADKALAAGAVNASAVIIYNNEPGMLYGTYGATLEGAVPGAGITQDDGASLLGELADGEVTVTLDLHTLVEEVETFNVIAETAQGRTDNVVMLGAHLDGVPDGPGINDNGSGSAAILETAVQLAKVNKLNNQVRFAWWGAEEEGLIGSWHYVEDLYNNSPEEIDDIATYLNFDMVGSPNYIIGVYDADESTYEAPVDVPEGSAATEEVFTDYFHSIDQPWVDTEFSGRSDYQGFIEVGIPASGLFTGADDLKTEEEVALFGGTAGIIHDPNYHTPADDIGNVNVDALEIMSKAIAHATITLAQDTSAINGERSAGKSGKPHPQGPLPAEEQPAA